MLISAVVVLLSRRPRERELVRATGLLLFDEMPDALDDR